MLPNEIIMHGETISIIGANSVSVTAVQNGLWSDPTTWDNGVPTENDTVFIPQGIVVDLFDEQICMDCIIQGTLLCSDFDLKVRTITVLNGGGIYLNHSGVLTIRAIPINVDTDPLQFANGIVVVNGNFIVNGMAIPTKTKVAKEILVGETFIELEEVPNWPIGAKIVLPDTDQDTDSLYVEEVEIIQAVNNGFVVTPVQHNHLGWRNQNGVVEELFSVGCLHQTIVIQSEDPSVVRGHIICAMHSDIRIKHCLLKELGRTTTAPLNSFANGVPGINQIGRYAFHLHHCLGLPEMEHIHVHIGHDHDNEDQMESPTLYQYSLEDIVVQGSAKWGIAIHHTHFGLVQNCFVYDCAGGHIITEDPGVYGNEIHNNLIIGNRDGSRETRTPQGGTNSSILARSHRNDSKGDHWHHKIGLGLASAANKITNNEIYSVHQAIGMAGFGTTQMRFPLVKGVHFSDFVHKEKDKTWFSYLNSDGSKTGTHGSYPWAFDTSHNKVMGCLRGIEVWTANSFPDLEEKMFPNLEIYNTKHPTDFEDQQETTLYGWKIKGDFSKLTTRLYAINFKDSYEFGHTHVGCEYIGYSVAYNQVLVRDYANFIDCKFECPTIIYQSLGQYKGPAATTFSNCIFLKVYDNLEFITGNYPKYGPELWAGSGLKRTDRPHLLPISLHLRPWIDGRDLDIYHYAQHIDWSLPESKRQLLVNPDDHFADFPPGVISQRELAELGTPIFGAVIPDGAEQFGKWFYAHDVSPKPLSLEERVIILEEKVKQLIVHCGL